MLLLPPNLTVDPALQQAVGKVHAMFVEARRIESDKLQIVVLINGTVGQVNGDKAVYPASVVKLVYLAYGAREISAGRLKPSADWKRATEDMIIRSNNDATGYVLDAITGTTSGPELPPKEFKAWQDRRNAVNRWIVGLGFVGENACQKTYNEGPYGREQAFRQIGGGNSNRLSPLFCAWLLDRVLSAPRDLGIKPKEATWAKGLLERPVPAPNGDDFNQVRFFSGAALPAGSKLWSKAGWTSTVRHDVAHWRLPDGREFTIAIFTSGKSDDETIVTDVARELLKVLA
jgi:hypothetical protein